MRICASVQLIYDALFMESGSRFLISSSDWIKAWGNCYRTTVSLSNKQCPTGSYDIVGTVFVQVEKKLQLNSVVSDLEHWSQQFRVNHNTSPSRSVDVMEQPYFGLAFRQCRRFQRLERCSNARISANFRVRQGIGLTGKFWRLFIQLLLNQYSTFASL